MPISKKSATNGFIAVTAVMILACSTILFANVALRSAIEYVDSVTRHEWRIQADLNAQSCLSTVVLMAVKDYFLEGNVQVAEFGCTASITRDHIRQMATIQSHALFQGVSSSLFEQNFIKI